MRQFSPAARGRTSSTEAGDQADDGSEGAATVACETSLTIRTKLPLVTHSHQQYTHTSLLFSPFHAAIAYSCQHVTPAAADFKAAITA